MRITILVTVLVWCAYTEAVHSSVAEGEPKEVPCPEAIAIYPCICTVLSAVDKDLDCSAVTSSDELARVFSAFFPLPDFNALKIYNNIYLTVIRDGDLGNEVTFKHIYIQNGMLSSIQANALVASHSTLLELDLDNNQLTSFPFEEISMFTSLITLNLRNNALRSFPFMSSTSLIYLNFNSNPLNTINSYVFDYLTRLEEISLNDCELQELSSGTFSGMPYLRYIDLRFNSLQTIMAGTFQLATSYNVIELDYNSISSVEVYGFQGTKGDLWMRNNQLTNLDEVVWKPLFTGVFTLYAENNPLGCSCDMAWVIVSDVYQSHLSSGTTCYDGTIINGMNPGPWLPCL